MVIFKHGQMVLTNLGPCFPFYVFFYKIQTNDLYWQICDHDPFFNFFKYYFFNYKKWLVLTNSRPWPLFSVNFFPFLCPSLLFLRLKGQKTCIDQIGTKINLFQLITKIKTKIRLRLRLCIETMLKTLYRNLSINEIKTKIMYRN